MTIGGSHTAKESEDYIGRDVLRLVLFAITSAALGFVSRASLKAPRSHGFYRFFAWECILALFFLDFINFQQCSATRFLSASSFLGSY